MITIDGSFGEGGGQMLRNAVALSALTGKEARIENIRARRDKPGLAAQHLTAVKGVASLCSAKVEGLELRSTELVFKPGSIEGGKHHLDVGTAGSVSLVLQACLIPSIHAEKESIIEVTGGTNVRMSPSIDYYEKVLFPFLRRMGAKVHLEVIQRGFYPQGNGKIRLHVLPTESLRSLDLSERGKMESLEGLCFSQNLPEHVCHRISHSARKVLLGKDVKMAVERSEGISTGAGILLLARFQNTLMGADALGERGMPSEKVGELAGKRMLLELEGKGTLDIHAADQLITYMALADGPSRFLIRELTGHLETQMWLIKHFLEVSFEVKKLEDAVSLTVDPTHT